VWLCGACICMGMSTLQMAVPGKWVCWLHLVSPLQQVLIRVCNITDACRAVDKHQCTHSLQRLLLHRTTSTIATISMATSNSWSRQQSITVPAVQVNELVCRGVAVSAWLSIGGDELSATDEDLSGFGFGLFDTQLIITIHHCTTLLCPVLVSY
jgi:hypothetical protein